MHEGAEAAMLLGDEAVMADAYALLAPFAGRLTVSGRASCSYGTVNLLLGRLAARLGRDEVAAAHIDAAEATAERGGLTALVEAARAARAGRRPRGGRPRGRRARGWS